MGVRKKGRRKIICNNETYFWYVELDCDSPNHILNIISEDKQLLIACPLNMKTPYIISKGNTFQNRKTNGCWNRYLLPFTVPESITPSFVLELADWAANDSGAVEVKWDGKDIVV